MINPLMGLNQYVSHMNQYQEEEQNKITVPFTDVDQVRSLSRQISKIKEETAYVKTFDRSPPTWKMNYLPSLNIIS